MYQRFGKNYSGECQQFNDQELGACTVLHISGWSSGSVAGVSPSQGVLMHRCQGVGRPPHVPSTPSHLEPELLLMASRCVLRPLRGKHPRGHTCSPGHLHPQSLVQDTVSIRRHPGPSKVREGQMFSLFGWPLAPEDSISVISVSCVGLGTSHESCPLE